MRAGDFVQSSFLGPGFLLDLLQGFVGRAAMEGDEVVHCLLQCLSGIGDVCRCSCQDRCLPALGQPMNGQPNGPLRSCGWTGLSR